MIGPFKNSSTVDSIIAPLTKILDQLAAHSDNKSAEVAKLAISHQTATEERDRARTLSNKLKELLGA